MEAVEKEARAVEAREIDGAAQLFIGERGGSWVGSHALADSLFGGNLQKRLSLCKSNSLDSTLVFSDKMGKTHVYSLYPESRFGLWETPPHSMPDQIRLTRRYLPSHHPPFPLHATLTHKPTRCHLADSAMLKSWARDVY